MCAHWLCRDLVGASRSVTAGGHACRHFRDRLPEPFLRLLSVAQLLLRLAPFILPILPACRGYQHFGGRGQQGLSAVVYSREARRRTLRWLVVLGGGGALIWVSSRQEIPYTGRK